MPVYEYWCQACRYTEEKLLNFKDGEKLFSCPKCGARLTRKISKIAYFEFKGNIK